MGLIDGLVVPQEEPTAFSPPLIRLQQAPPSPLGRRQIHELVVLLAGLLSWSVIGRPDVVAVAEGQLVPQSHLKIVQPAQGGIVREILVREGEAVAQGQVLMRMDTQLSQADRRAQEADFLRKRLTLARIDAELTGDAFKAVPAAPAALVLEVEA